MSKRAKEEARKAYNHFTAENIDEVLTARHFFVEGYEQAEEDLALTPHDIALIDDMLREVSNSIAVGDLPEMSQEKLYQEVLNRYNSTKVD